MKIAKGLTRMPNGTYTCSLGMLQRHLKGILRFVSKTDAIVFLTRKCEHDLVLMSYQYYVRTFRSIDVARTQVKHEDSGE